jgi:hypothetical protein
MRNLIILVAAVLAGCATASAPPASAAPDGPPDKVEVVYHPGTMFFSVEDGGEGRFKVGDDDFTFPVTHADYVRIRDLLAPYRETGLICGRKEQWEHNGYLVWREDGAETRRPNESTCYADGHDEAERGISRAYYAVQTMAEERWVPPPLPILPAPDHLTLTSLYWGRVTQEWIIPRGGEARWSQADGKTETFPVSEADFDRLRDIFRPYEGVRFECQRVIADGPYGHVTWSQQGHQDQQLRWDAGCVTGDAADVFQRWDQAEAMLKALRDGG